MGFGLLRLPAMSQRCPDPEAGFTLVEVLAALAIATMAIVMSLQLFNSTARANDRLIRETAARDLGRSLLASGETGEGDRGSLHWRVTLSDPASGLVDRHVEIVWAGGQGIAIDRREAAKP